MKLSAISVALTALLTTTIGLSALAADTGSAAPSKNPPVAAKSTIKMAKKSTGKKSCRAKKCHKVSFLNKKTVAFSTKKIIK